MTTDTEPTVADVTATEKRAALIAGWRHLLDLLEAHPELPIVHIDGYGGSPVSFCAGIVSIDPETGEPYSFSDDPGLIKLRMAEWSRLLMVGERKKAEGQTIVETPLLKLIGRTEAGLPVQVYGDRSAVCERKVVGSRVVEVPDPDAPKVTVTEDVVEWDCGSLLGAS